VKKLTVTDYRKQITALKREVEILRSDLKLALDRERSKDAQASHDFSQALMALNQLLTALHPGPWSPGVVLSFLEGQGYVDRWYISLTKFTGSQPNPTRTIIFKGRFETPRAAVKAAAEFLLPKNHSALVEQLRKAAEKL